MDLAVYAKSSSSSVKLPGFPDNLSLVGNHWSNMLSDHQNDLCAFSTYREIRRSDFQSIHCLQHRAFTLILQVVEGSFFRYEVRVANDRPHKEPVIRHFLTSRYSLTTQHRTLTDKTCPSSAEHYQVSANSKYYLMKIHPANLCQKCILSTF